MTRRQIPLFALAPLATAAATPGATPKHAAFPAEDPAVTLEMVGASHGRVERVRALLEQNPGLANAALDWGFGDWETALGAASHVGNREIAGLLLERGAVPTIFSAAMLGQIDLVKAFIATQPGVQRKYGPHGIPLLSHAKAGGAQAAEVFTYLKELGDAGEPLPTKPLDPADRDALAGRYIYGAEAAGEVFVVDVVKDQLGLSRAGSPQRRFLHHAGALEFFPAGAPWARLAFERDGGKSGAVTAFTLSGTGPTLKAKR